MEVLLCGSLPKVAGSVIAKLNVDGGIRASDGTFSDTARFAADLLALLSIGDLTNAKGRGTQYIVKPLCASVGQYNPLLSNGTNSISIKDFTDRLAKYVEFGR